ncbi:hypothetical protein [Novosphingobium sediminicola]|uniref:Uncharacterized protein n=1 Tax=Novosphingobium sediminicola TaxID=563162 RepID=A0A7W6CIF0_9SPHN|nr:hypothetical protein [Novosphingobium sediminicola]MBB3955234.1 hypothetical protein [Novosphingobium sediminicola]
MSPIYRLLKPAPGPRADRALRLTGLALLALAAGLVRLLFIGRHTLPTHPGSPWEMAVAMGAVLLFWAGNVLAMAGDALLRPMARPPRPL